MKTIVINRKRTNKTGILILALALIISVLAPAAWARAEQERMLVPIGRAVGIQIYTDGVMVVGLSATDNGTSASPAAVAGVLPGDLVIGLGGDKISSAEDFRRAADSLSGEPVSITVMRGEEKLQFTLEPKRTGEGVELGLWLRDTISGIGTLTYYDPQTGQFGGLGHSINDVDSGVMMPLGHGSIMKSSVSGVVKGAVGSPGELCGIFDVNTLVGTIKKNTPSGIFGELIQGKPSEDGAVPMGTQDDISLGKATILANVSGTDVEEFEIEIVRVYRNDQANRSMMIKVTDARLLERTGGIVQGMSGSPILQDGKLIGAVTHVMINDPTSGFAVTVENMVERSGD